MKLRILLATLPLAALLLAACGTDTPTAARAPERATLDGGSLGPGYNSAQEDTTGRGGSLGPGH